MNKLPYFISAVLLLALDWAALHDIVKGEPDLTLEYGVLIISLPLFAIVFYRLIKVGRPGSR